MTLCTICAVSLQDPGVYACSTCTAAARANLQRLADLAPELETTVARLGRSTPPVGGPGSGGPMPLPVELGAVDEADGIANTLTTWARLLHEEHGDQAPAVAGWRDLPALARWLAGHLEAIRRREWAAECIRDVRQAQRDVEAAIDRHAVRMWVGTCPAVREDETACGGDVWAWSWSGVAQCRTCGARHPAVEMRQAILTAGRDREATATRIASLLQVPAGTIRSWVSRRQHGPACENLTCQHGSCKTIRCQLVPRGQDTAGHPVYRIGDAMALLAAPTQSVAVPGTRSPPSGPCGRGSCDATPRGDLPEP